MSSPLKHGNILVDTKFGGGFVIMAVTVVTAVS